MHWRSDDGRIASVEGATRGRRRRIVGAVAIVAVLLAAATIGIWWWASRSDDRTESEDTPATTGVTASTSTSTTVSRSGGAADPRDDARVVACADPAPSVEVTNSSEVPMRFLVAVSIADANGGSLGTVGARAESVDAGATVTLQADAGPAIPEGATCTVAQVIKSPV